MENIIKGFKVFDPDWTCRDFQYEVGETYEHEGNIKLCGQGFHFCRRLVDCFSYYRFDSNNKVAIVEAIGLVESDDSKSVTNKIRIVSELSWHEVLELVNTGNGNSGYRNSGYRNSGDRNSGYRNSGDRNSGYRNSGNGNSGDWNSGDWNSGDGNSGVFCTKESTIKIFDVDTNMTLGDWRNSEVSRILSWNFEPTVWIYSENMSDEEKKQYPEHETLGGYLRTFSYKDACRNMWDSLTANEKEKVKNIPNFNKEKFEEITGIEI